MTHWDNWEGWECMYRSIIMFLSSLTTKKRKKSNKDKVINSTVPFSTSSEAFRIQKLTYRAHYFNFFKWITFLKWIKKTSFIGLSYQEWWRRCRQQGPVGDCVPTFVSVIGVKIGPRYNFQPGLRRPKLFFTLTRWILCLNQTRENIFQEEV